MPLFSHMQIVGFLMRWLNCDFIRNTDSNYFYIFVHVCTVGPTNADICILVVSLNCLSAIYKLLPCLILFTSVWKKVQVGKDQEKAQSEKDSHSKNQGGKKPN